MGMSQAKKLLAYFKLKKIFFLLLRIFKGFSDRIETVHFSYGLHFPDSPYANVWLSLRAGLSSLATEQYHMKM